jgi:flagella basal body P-ring formation protein FlgA
MKNKIKCILSLFFTCYSLTSAASQFQSPASIHDAIRQYIASSLPTATEYKLTLGQFDNRLQLTQCAETLEVYSHNKALKSGRNAIGVKCNGKKKWSIYNSVIIYIYKDVFVLSQAVRRGELFTSKHIMLEKKELSSLRSGYISDPKLIINKQASRNLGLGSVIKKSNLAEPRLIKRGERVFINASMPNIKISMAGIAMMDGIKGQSIRVKNIKSKRFIQATVIKSGQVAVTF